MKNVGIYGGNLEFLGYENNPQPCGQTDPTPDNEEGKGDKDSETETQE